MRQIQVEDSQPDGRTGRVRLGERMTNEIGDKRPQSEKFKDLARELECDDDEKSFDERLKRVASPPRPVKAERPQ